MSAVLSHSHAIIAGMSDRAADAAKRYHEDTKHSVISIRTTPHFLDWPNQPLPFKLYRDLEPWSLPTERELLPVPALDAIGAAPRERVEKTPAVEDLARLLYFSAGITKVKTFPGGQILFRAAACTGALYHIELYVACRPLVGLEAGVYHFGPSDFGLRRLRSGDWRAVLVAASGHEPAMKSAPAVLILTSTYWRNAWKYRERAYRHCFWDSGTLLANLLAEAAALDLPARVVLGFQDAVVNRLLDVDSEREVTLALVALGRDTGRLPEAPGTMDALGYRTVPLSSSEVDYPKIRQVHYASALETAEEVRDWRGRAANSEPSAACDLPKPSGPIFLLKDSESGLAGDPLEDVIVRRGSSRRFAREAISLAELSTILERSTRGIPADYLEPFGSYLNHLYLIVHAVDGLPAGAYYHDRDRHALEQLREGDFRREAGHLDLGQDLAADASVNVYSMCSLDRVLERFGNRGYRAAELEGGMVGGKIYLAAYAVGLGATGLTFFDDEVTRFFSPHAEGMSVMFLVAVGRPARRRVLYQR
jgi:SagB-type dehydrogenase family enzyme